MPLPSRIRASDASTAKAVTGFTGAAPQTVAGNTLSMQVGSVDKGTLSATVYAKATTNTLTITAKWQASDDGLTWVDCVPPNNAANVALVTGTGSAVTSTVIVAAPDGVYGKPYARCIAVSGTGSGGGAGTDEASITYNWREVGFVYG